MQKKMFDKIESDRDSLCHYTNEMNKSYYVYAELIRLNLDEDNRMRVKAKK